MFGEELVLCVDAVAVVERLGEVGGVGGGGGLAVAEHGYDYDVVGGERAVVFGIGEGGVDFPAVAGGYADCFGGRGVVRAVGEFYGDSGARYEGEGGYLIILYPSGIVR